MAIFNSYVKLPECIHHIYILTIYCISVEWLGSRIQSFSNWLAPKLKAPEKILVYMIALTTFYRKHGAVLWVFRLGYQWTKKWLIKHGHLWCFLLCGTCIRHGNSKDFFFTQLGPLVDPPRCGWTMSSGLMRCLMQATCQAQICDCLHPSFRLGWGPLPQGYLDGLQRNRVVAQKDPDDWGLEPPWKSLESFTKKRLGVVFHLQKSGHPRTMVPMVQT